jgi:hypothetical protein
LVHGCGVGPIKETSARIPLGIDRRMNLADGLGLEWRLAYRISARREHLLLKQTKDNQISTTIAQYLFSSLNPPTAAAFTSIV